MASHQKQSFVVLGAGVVGLSTAIELRSAYPGSRITVVAKHFPGDRSIEYASPWAGANWAPFSNDNGPEEHYDRVTYDRFGKLVDEGVGEEIGLGRMGMRGYFDSPLEETGLVTEETGKIWFDELVGGLKTLSKEESPEGAMFGVEFPTTFRINTQVYLNWYGVVFCFFVFLRNFLAFATMYYRARSGDAKGILNRLRI